MDGLIFVVGVIGAATIAGLRARTPSRTPGVLLSLTLVAVSFWYVFA